MRTMTRIALVMLLVLALGASAFAQRPTGMRSVAPAGIFTPIQTVVYVAVGVNSVSQVCVALGDGGVVVAGDAQVPFIVVNRYINPSILPTGFTVKTFSSRSEAGNYADFWRPYNMVRIAEMGDGTPIVVERTRE